MSTDSPFRYRFGPRNRRGLVAGARTGQVLVVTAGLVAGVGALRSVRGPTGVLAALVTVLAAVALACWPVRGRTVEEWLPVAARFTASTALGQRRSKVEVAAAVPRRRPPGVFSSLEVVPASGAALAEPFGTLHDARQGTWTAVLSVAGDGFPLLGDEERTRRVASWSGVLAAIAAEAGELHRIQWIERTVPDPGSFLRRHLEPAACQAPLSSAATGAGVSPALGAARRSYAELLDAEGTGVNRHELLLVCTIRPRRAGSSPGGGPHLGEAPPGGIRLDSLAEELSRLDRRCREAGISVDGVLSPAGLRAFVRRSFEPLPAPVPASWPWPVAIECSWASVRVDGTWHATYWVAEWPRSDVGSDFLLPLLVGCRERRTVSLVMAPVPPGKAIRAAEHARTSGVADAELRRRHGFDTPARRRREQEAVVRREGELAEGHVAYRFSGYVTVTVAEASLLEGACARLEQAAALARLEIRRLYGAQDEALLCTIPSGRGCA